MKTKLLTLLTVALVQGASAISFQYSDYRDADLVAQLLSNNTSIAGSSTYASGVFDIVDDDGDTYTWDKHGFNYLSEVITGAQVAFGFYDLSQSTATYLGDFRFLLGEYLTAFSGTVGDLGTTAFEFNLATPYLGYITGDLLLDLQQDGKLAWRVELDDQFAGEVTLYWAALAADAEPIPDSGSTAAFLGLSLFAGLLVRRRMVA